MSRRAPRPLGIAVEDLRDSLAPTSLLGRVQMIWEQAVGEAIAAEARPVSEHDGVLTVACSSAVWAAELRMLSAELAARCNDALAGGKPIVELRSRVDGGHEPAARRPPG